MKSWQALGGVLFGLCACGGEDAVTLDTSAATEDQCPAGGVVLSVEGIEQAVVCNGVAGNTGEQGEQGDPGVDVLEQGVIADTLYCVLNDGVTFLSVYVWEIQGRVSPLNNVAICRLGEPNFADTVPVLGTRCSMLSPAKGVVEIAIDVEAGTAVASGDMMGALDCS